MCSENKLCTPVPFPRNVAGWIHATLGNMANQMAWSQDKTLRNWMRESRLDGFGKLTASVSPDDTEKMAVLGAIRQYGMAAALNAKSLR